MIEARAPGKLVVAGEYAVLAGGPGIAVAVDVPARVTVQTLAGGGSRLEIPETGARHPFRWIAGGPPRWEQTAPGPYGFPLEAVVEILYARRLLQRAGDLPPCAITISTEAFHSTDARGQRHKLGLGSSAAVVVALTGALLRFIGGAPVDQATLLATCFEAHRRLQGGSGSGIDVAAALSGGVIGAEFPAAGQPPRVSPLAWPRQLHGVALWTGQSASTPALLGRLRQWQERQGPAAAGILARLSGASGRVLAAWRGGSPDTILEALAHFTDGLRVLDEAAGIGIFSPEHLQLMALAREHCLVCKPSGAGGGDFALAFSAARETLEEFRTAAEIAGFRCLGAGFGGPGLSVTGGGHARGAPQVRTRQGPGPGP